MKRLKRHIGVHHINTWQKFSLFFVIIIVSFFAITCGVRAYLEVFDTNLSIEKLIDIKLKDPIVINFSVPIFTDDYEEKIKIIPEEKYKLRWEDSNKKLKIFPARFWKPQESYEIFLPEAKNIMFTRLESQRIAFSTQKYPKVIDVSPDDGAKDAVVGAEDPVMINFEKSSADFSIRFILNSKIQSNFQTNSAKTQFKLLPKEGIEDGALYNLAVEAKYRDEADNYYRQIFASSFETLPPANIIWDKDFSIRLEQARRYTRAKIKTGKYIDVNLSAQVMSIFKDGSLLDSFMISSGKSGMDTPKMETQIYNKFPRAYSATYGLFMPNWMALMPSGKYGIHELPEWPSGYKEGANHLGIPVSHGCVRLGVGSAERVYNFAEIGTPVIIY